MSPISIRRQFTDSIHSGHLKHGPIEQENVWTQLRCPCNGFGSIGSLAYDYKLRFRFKQTAQTIAKYGLDIGDKDAHARMLILHRTPQANSRLLLHHPHLGPVVRKVLAAVEADDVESRFTLRYALPVAVARVLPARRDRRERQREAAMAAASKQLECFVPRRSTHSSKSCGGRRLWTGPNHVGLPKHESRLGL